jgi:hypothetical protein
MVSALPQHLENAFMPDLYFQQVPSPAAHAVVQAKPAFQAKPAS